MDAASGEKWRLLHRGLSHVGVDEHFANSLRILHPHCLQTQSIDMISDVTALILDTVPVTLTSFPIRAALMLEI